MNTTTFDTSGIIHMNDPLPMSYALTFPDLSPFEQGYVKAAFESLPRTAKFLKWDERLNHTTTRLLAFRDLAPETLAAMRADCVSFANMAEGLGFKTGEVEGRRFWHGRQGGMPWAWGAAFPPITLALRNDRLLYQEVRT